MKKKFERQQEFLAMGHGQYSHITEEQFLSTVSDASLFRSGRQQPAAVQMQRALSSYFFRCFLRVVGPLSSLSFSAPKASSASCISSTMTSSDARS